MIKTTADEATMNIYVANIIAVWNRGTDDQLTRGRVWYRVANDLATAMADGNTVAGAGVIAALSPQTAWSHNIKLAGQAFTTGEARGHLRNALGKAKRIMEGQDPLIVLPVDSKTYNFFRCIVDPTDADPVVIDRHAHDIAVGKVYGGDERGLSSTRRYATLALAYRLAGQRLGELPSVVQAATWVIWRDEITNTSTRGDLS